MSSEMARPGRGVGRLGAVAALVPHGARVADVGAGDGRLAAWLVGTGRASFCVATERTERAAAAVRASVGDGPGLDVRRGEGLGALRPEDGIEVVVVAGMGARKIRGILDGGNPRELGIRRLVLQPQTEPRLLRRWLLDHGWRIAAGSRVVERGRLYEVMAAEDPERGAPVVDVE
jgi:tRNA (adenine22-N1)-methyltransferase